jgi:hypothetical protein
MEKIMDKNLKKKQKSDPRVIQIVDSKEDIKWIPLLLCWPPDKYLGITEDGYWVVESTSGMRFLDLPNEYLRVKILLERSLDDIRIEFNKNLCTHSLEGLTFPYVNIISQVFVSDSDYWVELAFSWFDQISSKEKKSLLRELEIIQTRKVLSQKLRQKAIKEHSRLKTMCGLIDD